MNIPASLSMPNPVLDDLDRSSEHVFTSHDGRRISWRMWGEGMPLVLLHGGSGSWKHWVRQIGPFAATRRVIAPDLPGFGLSDYPAEPVNFEGMGRDIAAGLDEVMGGPMTYDIAAFSYGGSITSQLLFVHPGRQRRVALCAAAGFGKPAMPPMRKVRGLQGEELVETHRFNLNSIMIADQDRIDDLALRIQHENTMLSRLRARDMNRGVNLLDVLPGFSGEVAAFWGERDAFMLARPPTERGKLLRELRPDAEVHYLPDTGHWLIYEAADRVNPLLTGFLNR